MTKNSVKLTFCGASRTVTGSKYLLEVGKFKMLIDCGLFEGWKELRQRNWQPVPFNPHELDAVILTHAHLDHSGAVPLIIKQGYRGPIYASPATRELCSILLPDSGHLQEEDAEHANRHGWSRHTPALPLYTAQEAEESLEQFRDVNFGETLQLDHGRITVRLQRAGHILGAASILVTTPDCSLFFSGDVGRPHDPLMVAPEAPPAADYYIVESTYGARLHDPRDVMDQIADTICRTAARGGTILVPAFAVGRTQSLLYYLAALRQKQKIPDMPIYLDSPMAINATDLFCKYDKTHTHKDVAHFCNIASYTRTREESKKLDANPMPSIIIAASGMLTGGRILHHLKHFLGDARHTVMLTGYQSDGTRGDLLLRGVETIKIHGTEWPVKAEIVSLQNISAHADYQEMVDWLKQSKKPPKRIYLVHGNDEAVQGMAAQVETQLKWKTTIPSHMQEDILV